MIRNYEEISNTAVKFTVTGLTFFTINKFKLYLLESVPTYAIHVIFINTAPRIDQIIRNRIGLIPLFNGVKGDYITINYEAAADVILTSDAMVSHNGTTIPEGVELFPLRKGDKLDIFCTTKQAAVAVRPGEERHTETSYKYTVVNRVSIKEIRIDQEYEIMVNFIDWRYNKLDIINSSFQEVKLLY